MFQDTEPDKIKVFIRKCTGIESVDCWSSSGLVKFCHMIGHGHSDRLYSFLGPWPELIDHSQEHSLSFSPRFC